MAEQFLDPKKELAKIEKFIRNEGIKSASTLVIEAETTHGQKTTIIFYDGENYKWAKAFAFGSMLEIQAIMRAVLATQVIIDKRKRSKLLKPRLH